MYERLLKIPHQKSFFLFGPRGTGKTSWIKKHFSNGLYLDLLESDLYIELLAQPQKLEQMIPKKFDDWIIIDEIQKIPELLNEVHRLIETFKYKFAMTGSSARSLRKKGVNLLAGRALTYRLYPLTALELGEDFDIQKSLQFGHLPALTHEPEAKAYLTSYVKTYLREEVLQEGLTRNLAAFSRFLESASFSQGGVLNMSALAREVSIHRKVVESYFQILEDLLIGTKLPIFTKRAKRNVIAHPKFYFFDVGVFRTIRPRGPLDSEEEAQGPALETLVYQELVAINAYYNLEYEFYYWRTENGLEIDFILYGPKGIVAIEVKRSKKVTTKELKALQLFIQDYPGTRAFFLYGGTRREFYGDIQAIPIVEAIKQLPTILQ